MKKVSFLVSLVMLSFGSIAQFSMIKEKKDSVQVYGGLIAQPSLSLKTGEVFPNGAFRTGVAFAWYPKDWVTVKMLGFVESCTMDKVSGDVSVYADFQPTYWLKISAGYVPSLFASAKPNPISLDGQLAKWTENQIPSNMPGVKASFRVDQYEESYIDLNVGAFVNSDNHLSIQFGWFVQSDEEWNVGLACTLSPSDWGMLTLKNHFYRFDITVFVNSDFINEPGFLSSLGIVRLERCFNSPIFEGVEFSNEVALWSDDSRLFRIDNELIKKFSLSKKYPIKGAIGISHEVYSGEILLKAGISL